MADWTRRERTTTHVEYVLTSPTNWGEVGKLNAAIRSELGPELSQWDNVVQVIAADGEIIFRFEKEDLHGR
ncbi:hypothetical protein [Nonomuraea angiospora]|uniref:hypothetical protein n=1 Tax=Nonomuraea angiospora TaxID=46172 RepID=UPI0029B38F1C|nr:hypothetical protein [Nonomuraea angiospora]MDX3111544.1 hypothetical protein [Nonomuraea angiospora]